MTRFATSTAFARRRSSACARSITRRQPASTAWSTNSPPRTARAGHSGYVTELVAPHLAKRIETRRSTPAARRRCSRRSAHSARSTAFQRSWRWSPAWPAASALATAASCRPRTATRGFASTARCSRRPARHGDLLWDGALMASSSAASSSSTRSSTARGPTTRWPRAACSATPSNGTSRSPRTSPRRSRSSRAQATRRRASGSSARE